MQALKALVVIMGILIFVAMGFLVYGLLGGGGSGDAEKAMVVAPFNTVESRLPAGASVGGVSVKDGRVVVHLRLADGGVEIRIFDLSSGAALGVIRLGASP